MFNIGDIIYIANAGTPKQCKLIYNGDKYGMPTAILEGPVAIVNREIAGNRYEALSVSPLHPFNRIPVESTWTFADCGLSWYVQDLGYVLIGNAWQL